MCPQPRCIECCDTDLLLHLFEAKYFKQQILCFLHLSRPAIIGNYVLVHGLQFFTQLKEQFSFVHFFLKPNLPRPPEWWGTLIFLGYPCFTNLIVIGIWVNLKIVNYLECLEFVA